MRKVKCKFCELMEDKENMVKHGNRYVHQTCLDEHMKSKKDRAELEDYILKVHGISTIPNNFFYALADLKNGTIRRGNSTRKGSNGYSYATILATYKKYSGNIKYAKETKNFHGSTYNLLKYTLAIIKDKVDSVDRIRKKELIKRKDEVRLSKQIKGFDNENKKVEYKVRDSGDISDFIDN